MTTILYSKSMSVYAASRLRKTGFNGVVYAVFNRSFYILEESSEVEKHLVCVGSPSICNGPMNLIIDGLSSLRPDELGIKPGMKVEGCGDFLDLGNRVIVALDSASKWVPAPILDTLPVTLPRLKRGLEVAEVTTCQRGNKAGMGFLLATGTGWPGQPTLRPPIEENVTARLLRDRAAVLVPDFLHAVLGCRITDAIEVAGGLIGLGPGLTPAGDDFLGGFMAGLLWFAKALRGRLVKFVFTLNKGVAWAARMRTTLISQVMLRHAALGCLGEAPHELIASLLTGNLNEVPGKTLGAIAMGSTSGTDIVTGILLGMRIGIEMNKV